MKTTKQIVEEMDKKIVGQEDTKHVLALASTMQQMRHYQKFIADVDTSPIVLPVILLAGPSGSGKTSSVRALAAATESPLLEIDATSCSPPGWHGHSVEEEFGDLIGYIKYQLQAHQSGLIYSSLEGGLARSIVFIDEFDKLFTGSDKEGYHQEKVNSWLKVIEGKIINARKGKTEIDKISTEDVLFILGGSFNHAKTLLKPKRGPGFVVSIPEAKELDKKILSKLGFPDELLGRITAISRLTPLDRKTMKKILHLKDGLLQQYKKYARLFGYELVIHPEDVEEIVELAMNDEMGARKLNELVFNFYKDKLFTLDFNDMTERTMFL